MGRVAFDPGELQSLAGQFTSAGGSLLGVQSQVASAAADPGLLPSGAGLAGQAVAAVVGLLGAEAGLVNIAGQITATVAEYEAAMVASGAVPVLTQIFNPEANLQTAGRALSWAMNAYDGLSYDMGHATAGGMDSLSAEIRTKAPWAWPAMEAMHKFLGTQMVHQTLKIVAAASGAASAGLAAAALALAPIPGVDVGDVVLAPLADALAMVNVEADLLLVAGGDDSRETETDLGSAEIGVASIGFGRGLGVAKDISEAADGAGEAGQVAMLADSARSVSQTRFSAQANDFMLGLSHDDPFTSSAYQDLMHDNLVAQITAQAAASAAAKLQDARSVSTVVAKMGGLSDIADATKSLQDASAVRETTAFFVTAAQDPGQAAAEAWNTASGRLWTDNWTAGPAGKALAVVETAGHVNDLAGAVVAATNSANHVRQGAELIQQHFGPEAQKLLRWLASHPPTPTPTPGGGVS